MCWKPNVTDTYFVIVVVVVVLVPANMDYTEAPTDMQQALMAVDSSGR